MTLVRNVGPRGARGRPEADPTAPMNDKFEQMRKEDARLVKGKFINNESKGAQITFAFRKWKGDPVKTYTLKDGEEYELPIAVVKHLVENCNKIEDSYFQELGTNVPRIVPKRHARFSFVTSDFYQ